MASLFRSFSNLLLKRPLATQCVTSAILFASGDIIAQQAIERKREKHDFSRTARLAFFGGCLLGPPVSKWIAFLNRLHFATPTKAVIYRVGLSISISSNTDLSSSPDMYWCLVCHAVVVGWFFASMSLMEGKGLSGVVDGLSTMYAPTLMRGWAVYTPTQIINFALVPPQFRFVFVGVVNLVWNTYLSTVNARLSRDIEEPVGY
ncbi:hypothetical protein F5888DRAFT_1800128 [Russula emetica]|nr:hypothetical protein F5888DRAFT_1800128 [Russula emetica]